MQRGRILWARRYSRREAGLACIHGDVRLCGVLRRAVRRIPELRACALRRDHTTQRGGLVALRLLHHRQGAPLVKERTDLPACLVVLLYRPSDCGSRCRQDGKYLLRVLVPIRHALGAAADPG